MKETPASKNFYFPPEWHAHRATWLSWPHNQESWPGKIDTIYQPYSEFVAVLSHDEEVCINVSDAHMQNRVLGCLAETDANLSNIRFYNHPTNDAWCRDHGPAFVINDTDKAIINWGYNAWGDKYPPYDLDNKIPSLIAEALQLPIYSPGIVVEGGSIEVNGLGVLMTTKSCLLNPNRNPGLNQQEIEQYLKDYYGAKYIWWLGDGIVGDDTDGHIDDITRFVDDHTIVTVIEPDVNDENHQPLQENLQLLKQLRSPDGKDLNIVELPMPRAINHEGQRLPASYANFYIGNATVVVPTYRDPKNDPIALEILQGLFKDRKVIGIDSTDIVWGLGSFHCLSQQEPSV